MLVPACVSVLGCLCLICVSVLQQVRWGLFLSAVCESDSRWLVRAHGEYSFDER